MAFWLQNEELSFGVGKTQSVVKQWIESEGYSYFTYEEIAEQNLKANPAETVKEFVEFCYEW
ncbi:MAG: hypothetical protein K2O59_09985 [Lachnospiraceae bacterium]|nr:hypothetical protein [Lachnospiraceae bacterium]